MKKIEKFTKKKLLNHFNGIYKACNNTFWYGCGSYLFDGKNYQYQNSIKDCQKNFPFLFYAFYI